MLLRIIPVFAIVITLVALAASVLSEVQGTVGLHGPAHTSSGLF